MKTRIEIGASEKNFNGVVPENVENLDMVIAFDTTGSMAAYIDDVRRQVSDLVPKLFECNPDLRLGVVAFGDYCDMESPTHFGRAYQCLQPTDDICKIMEFIRTAKNTSGGDGDEFYELVLKKIVSETQWRRGSQRVLLLIADAEPHRRGYSYPPIVENAQIDWREEAAKAVRRRIKIDTVSINPLRWMRELSAFTNGVNIPFHSSGKTAVMIEATVNARGGEKARAYWDQKDRECFDAEMRGIYDSLRKERNSR